MNQARFSVCQVFHDDSCQYVRRFVDVDEAVEAFASGAQIGSTKRVIVTDGSNCVSLEWNFGEGIRKVVVQM